MTFRSDCTVAICTRNSGSLLARAVRSALDQSHVLIVDDYSTDGSIDTVVREFPTVAIVRPTIKIGLGNARHTAVNATKTEWLAWLDADDEFLEGRVERLLAFANESAADIVFDSAELFDGSNAEFVCVTEIPAFLFQSAGLCSLFSRNWLPGSAWPLVRTSVAHSVGYNINLLAAEDLDFNLRSILARHKISLCSKVGYRQYSYSNSLSRNLAQQNSQVRDVLLGIDSLQVKRFLIDSGLRNLQIAVLMGTFYLRREDVSESLACFFDSVLDSNRVTKSEDALLNAIGVDYFDIIFFRGVLLALQGYFARALEIFTSIARQVSRAEVYNNIGVCHANIGDKPTAAAYFQDALRIMPSYLDAQINVAEHSRFSLTRFPLRRTRSRSSYGDPRQK